MIFVTRELGANIVKCRKRAGVTQQQMADALSAKAERQISLHMVSAWERGERDVPAAMIPAICDTIHCTSFELYPHSNQLTDRDMRMIDTIIAMGEDEKDDLYYLLCEWRGDRKAMLKLDVLHAVQSPAMRREPVRLTLRNYAESIKTNDPTLDRRAHVDFAYVQRAWKKLLDEEDDPDASKKKDF